MPLRSVVLMVASILFLYLLFTVGAPFLLALVAAIFLEPLTKLFMKYGRMNRMVSSIISSTLFTLILLGVMSLIGMKLVSEMTSFLSKLPAMLESSTVHVQGWLDQLRQYTLEANMLLPENLENWLSNLMSAIGQLSLKVSDVLVRFAAGVPDFFIFFIVFLVAVYLFAFSLPTMKETFLSWFDDKSKLQVESVLDSLRKSVFGFLRAQLLLSIVTYLITFVGLLMIGTGYPLAIALLIVIVDILPVLGTGSVLVPWAAYMFVTGDLYAGLGLLLLYMVITVVRRIIEPKILGDAVGIGALSTLISLYVGYELVGLVGVFLGPIVVIVFSAMRKAGLLEFKIKFE